MQTVSRAVAAAALLVAPGLPATAQQLPPIRQIGSVVTATAEKLGAVSAIRQLPDGKVLVNDIIGRRVLLFDSTLKSFTVVADTTSATANAYGARPGGLIPFRGDSTLFVDPASLSMLVIDGNGRIARVMSVPRASDAFFLIGGPFGSPGFDPQGRLVYRAPPGRMFAAGAGARSGGGAGGISAREAFTPPVIPDSAPLVRVDLATRKLDTLTFFKTPKIQMNVTRTPDGGIRVLPTINPLPLVDDWAVLPDGTIALVRGRDFHVDWIAPDKSVTSSPKIPYEWERLTDEGKVAFIDSTRKAMEEARASGNLAGVVGGAMLGGGPMIRMGGPPGPGAVGDLRGGQVPPLVEPAELPDYKPPFPGGATRVDAEGNLWIRTTQNVKGLPVYNVINRKGEVIDRVQLPAGRVIAGFGAGGIAYLASRDGEVARLEKARIR